MCFVPTGATFALSTTTDIGRIISIDGFDEELTSIPDDDLATIGHDQYCPGGKISHTPLGFVTAFDPDTVKSLGTLETGTLTLPPQAGQTNGATLAGTGFLRKRGFNGMENNVRTEGAYEFQFDGKTGPVYTPGS